MYNDKYSATFFGRKSKDGKHVNVYIILRISGTGEKRISTGLTIPASNWRDGKFVGRSATIAEFEKNANILKEKLKQAFFALVQEGLLPTPDAVIAKMQRMKNTQSSLMQVMDQLIKMKEEMHKAGDASRHLPVKFKTIKDDLTEYLKKQYGKSDIFLYEINLQFIEGFVSYLRTIPNNNVTINKKIGNLGQGFIYAVKNKWLDRNPCELWKPLPEPKTNNEYLSLEQFKELLDFKLPNSSYEVVKDTFIFMSLTGLAFSDMNALTFSKVKTINGSPFLCYVRNKTKRYEKEVWVPLVSTALDILNKYYMKPKRTGRRDKRAKGADDKLFDTVQAMTNYNIKLKSLFDYNEMILDFEISSHCARKTFGNLVTNQIGISDASQMLGHSSISITETAYVDNQAQNLLIQRYEKFNEVMNQELKK